MGECQWNKVQVPGLAAQLVLGTTLGLQFCALGKKQKMHREVGREGLLKAEGISKYS